jgi:hypothetical protein
MATNSILITTIAATFRRHPSADSTTAYKPTAPVIPSNARDLLFPGSDCNISVSSIKSLRQIANPSYNLYVEKCVQAPTAAPIFLQLAHRRAVTLALFFDLGAPRSPSFSSTCTLLKDTLPQPTDSQPLAHSLKNIGGMGVSKPVPRLPILGRRPVAAIVSRIAGLSRRSWRDRTRILRRSPSSRRESRPNTQTAPKSALSIFTCNKKAIYSTLTRNRRKRTESEERL